ncbi:methionine--tRNA ligase [Candidatus Wolfebacteria bacterium CG1_02_39_135]|nr:methionine--tRNA ligase [Parcubacteria group bacterium]NCP58220.1 methionine--tRNA ligase [Candidatus Wolfebacteria bacterium]OIO65366.1 MAG: methionine--tRNA ligase [Candidatus Wolfebacteria bacterium CG1_02_39_135]
MEKFYITTPIYYATDRPHIGHAFATLHADVISRHKKLQGKEVFFLTGTDEHGVKIAEKAAEENKTPQEYVDETSSHYKEVWNVLNINFSDFIRTTDPKHKEGVFKFIKKLFDSGAIYKDKYKGLYCIGCERFLAEKDLINGLCPNHLRPPQKISEENYFFDLQKYLPEIRRKIKTEELKISPASRRNETLGFIEAGIDNFSITREKVKWGIPFPEDENQTIYVWVEALMNYVTALDFPDGEKYKKFWPADLHIIGAEINKFHTVFWPAMLLAINEPLPKEIFIHGLFTVNGQKMSKSLGNVIDPLALIEKFGPDASRYLLLSQFPASEHGDIKEEQFIKKYNADLANGIGNLFERVLTMAKSADLRGKDAEILAFYQKIQDDYSQKMNNYQLYEALAAVFSFVKKLDQYINTTEPWRLIQNKNPETEKILNTLIFGIKNIIVWLKPFMPKKMEKAENYLENLGQSSEKLNLFPRI